MSNILATITFDEAKKIIQERNCDLLDQNIYEGIDITKNNLNIDQNTMIEIQKLFKEILIVALGIPRISVAKNSLDVYVNDETIYRMIDNLQKDVFTLKIRETLCDQLQSLSLAQIIKGVI